LLVEVHAASVNPLDVANILGLLGTPLPMIPGGDFAGVVVSDGDHAGREVWGSGPALGMALGVKRPVTHARFVALPETWLSRKPERLTMTEAGAVGRAFFTAWQTVINIMGLMPGETILITGGAGMVGQAATAIARWRGAKPIVAVFMDGADVARIFDQLRPLFDRGFLTPPAVNTWPLEKGAEAYQTVRDGSAGIKQVLLPAGG